MNTISVTRTGNIYSIASTEYIIIYPDGSTEKVWTPPWNDWDDEEEDSKTLEYAEKRWIERINSGQQ
jgi:hypothetical protein